MPQQNAWLGGHAAFNPFGSQLQGVVKHSFAKQLKRARDHLEEKSGVQKRVKLEDRWPYKGEAAPPPAIQDVEMVGRRYPARRGVKRRRTPRRRSFRRKRFPRELWPRQRLVRLKSSVSGSLYTSAGAWDGTNGFVAIKANSLNDPWAGESTALPLGTDQLAAMYQQYVIVGATIIIHAHASSLTGAARIGLALKNTATSLASADHYAESPMSQVKIVSGDVDVIALSSRYKAKKFWQVRKFQDAEDLQAAFSTTPGDPTKLAYWHLWVQDLNANEACTFEYQAYIIYDILLSDPIVPSRSAL